MNIELAEQILNQIKSKPKTHYQGHWWDNDQNLDGNGDSRVNTVENVDECGSTACVAGWALLFSGYKFRTHHFVDQVQVPGETGWQAFPGWIDPLTKGANLLGLDPQTAYSLFHSETEEEAIEVLEDLVDAEKTARKL